MTIRDEEVVELLHDEPELLAIADAVAETQARPRPTQARWFATRAGGALAVAAVVLIAVLLWPGGGGRPHGVLGKALAALGDGPVLHLVVRQPVGAELVELNGTRTIVPQYEMESWSDHDFKHSHMILRLNGRPLGEFIVPDDLKGSHATVGPIDPAYAALWTGYREALENGSAKVEREDRLYGRPVYWLRFPPSEASRAGSLVAIDRRTYSPLAFRYESAPGRYLEIRVLLARLEAYDPADFTRRTNVPNLLNGVTTSSGSASSGPVLPGGTGKPWLTAGPTVAGLPQTSVSPFMESSSGRSAHGFDVVYGSETGSQSLRISELKRPPDRSEWKGIPRGFVRVSEGESSGSDNKTTPLWTGNLVVDGVYVTIETGVSRDALLTAARSLRPA
ncbi:MAG TPA: hypothetical protein VLK24_06440 [Gaiellaceae bacterium]|nr:hypothetical protein [Gaiellaceae bacterium]